MRINFKGFLITGYVILLLVNCFEVRSGITISALQLTIGLFIFLPKLLRNNDYQNIRLSFALILYLLTFLLGIFYNYFSLPNHFFVFFAITLIIVLYEDLNVAKENFRWLFIVLMGFATIHKLAEPTFINGDFVGFMMAKGGFFYHIINSGLFSELKQSIIDNNHQISYLMKSDPVESRAVILDIPSISFNLVVNIFSYLIIIGELVLTLLFVFLPSKKYTLFFLWVFINSIVFITVELEFISTLLFIGLILCPNDFKLLNKSYGLSFLFYAFLSIAFNGYHLF